MNEQEIRDNAPDGARFYCISNQNKVIYFKYNNLNWLMYYLNGFWVNANPNVDRFIKPLP